MLATVLAALGGCFVYTLGGQFLVLKQCSFLKGITSRLSFAQADIWANTRLIGVYARDMLVVKS